MPRTLRLVLPLLVLLLLAACAHPLPLGEGRGEGGSATASPTPLPPTATPQPTATSTPTATPPPTPLPLAVRLTNTLLAAYADGHAEASQAPNGGWQVRFTAPTGQTVELKDVSAENLTMPDQDWVENYNGGKILLEGRAEDGRLWRVVEKNGERMLMYGQETPIRMDVFPYWWWGDGLEGKAKVKVPGNGRLEWLKVTRSDQKDDQGHWVWLDEQGKPVELSNLGYMYVEKILPHDGKPTPKEMQLPVVVLTNWQVEALEASDGHEYAVREGKIWVDGQAVSVPETKSGVAPESLMFNTKDGQWYLGWQGIALWRVEDGQIVKYDRPVWMTSKYMEKVGYGQIWAQWKKDFQSVREIDYSSFTKFGQRALGVVGGISSERWNDNILYVFDGFIAGVSEMDNGVNLGIRLPQPFGDVIFVSPWSGFNESVRFATVVKGEGMLVENIGLKGEDLVGLFTDGESISVYVVLSNSGNNLMGQKLHDGRVIFTQEEALALKNGLEKEFLQGKISGERDAFLGEIQQVFIPSGAVGFGK